MTGIVHHDYSWRPARGNRHWCAAKSSLRSKAWPPAMQIHEACKPSEIAKELTPTGDTEKASVEMTATRHPPYNEEVNTEIGWQYDWSIVDTASCNYYWELSQNWATYHYDAVEPYKKGDCDKMLVAGCGAALTWMAKDAVDDSPRTCFHSSVLPKMSISSYMDRLRRLFNCSSTCFVICLIYIDRLVKRNPQIPITPLTMHRLVISAMLLTVKFNEDKFYSNSHYAKVGGVSIQELNLLERRFLQLLDWKLMVEPDEYDMYRAMVCQAAMNEASWISDYN